MTRFFQRAVHVEIIARNAVESATLQAENTRLSILAKESEKKAGKLATQIKKREISDKEEADALDAMASRVEANLLIVTARATKAEAQVRDLQMQLDRERGQRIAASTQHLKLQCQNAAQHLTTAATNAEKSLRTLFEGVQTLKLASEILLAIDSITPVED